MFKSLFKKKINDKSKKIYSEDDSLLTIACILVEAALVDDNFGEEEKNIIVNILHKNYSKYKIEDILITLNKAIEYSKDSSDLISFTKKIKKNWPIEKRIEVIEMLWKVCLVDGILEPYEDMLIRRVAGLIYVDDKDRNIAKKNAEKKLKNYK